MQLQKILDEEYNQLLKDRKYLREVCFPNGDFSWPLPVNLRRIIQMLNRFSTTVGTGHLIYVWKKLFWGERIVYEIIGCSW